MENLYNKYLKIRAWVWSKIPRGKKLHIVKPPSNYKLVFEDDFQFPPISDKWGTGHPWGRFHPDFLFRYWDHTGVSFNGENKSLNVTYLPKHFVRKDLPPWEANMNVPEEFIIPYSVGLLSTNQQWKYGWFEGKFKIPESRYQWCAFWLMSKETWPPEIDIFETESRDNPKKDWKIRPNLIRREDNEIRGIPPPVIPLKLPFDRWVQFAVHWTKDFINYYYDGIKVISIKDPNKVNRVKYPMYLIVNNGLYPFSEKGLLITEYESELNSSMEVKDIKIYQES